MRNCRSHTHALRDGTREHAGLHTYTHPRAQASILLQHAGSRSRACPIQKGSFSSRRRAPSGKFAFLLMMEEFSCKNTTQIFWNVWVPFPFLKAKACSQIKVGPALLTLQPHLLTCCDTQPHRRAGKMGLEGNFTQRPLLMRLSGY